MDESKNVDWAAVREKISHRIVDLNRELTQFKELLSEVNKKLEEKDVTKN